jgi:hypothetical protein
MHLPLVLLLAVEVTRASSGALFVDDFDNEWIDHPKWNVSFNDPGINMVETEGVLRIFGTTADTLSGNPHMGLLSRYTTYENPPNAVALADLRLPVLGTPSPDGWLDFWGVHLCNWAPDRNTTTAFTWRSDAWGWWLRVRDEVDISYSTPYVPAYGDESSEFHTCQVEHRDDVSTGSVWNGAAWDTLGAPVANVELVNKRLELKSVVYPRNFTYRAEWDNARLFEHPADAPLRFVVPSANWTVEVFHEGTHVDSASAAIDTAFVHLDLRAPIPYEIEVRVHDGGTILGSTMIPVSGVDGAYPGDVWVVTHDPTAVESGVETSSWGSTRGRYRGR